MEEWRDTPGHEGLYQVSNEGRVKSLNYNRTGREKLLIPSPDGRSYLFVTLYKDGKKKHPKVHRLVAQAFIPNPNGYTDVNHKDEDKTNNRVENLEWCSATYNNNYGTRNQRAAETQSKKVYQYTLDGTLVKIWKSTRECGRNGFNQGEVAACCRGERKTHKGFRWSYVPL